MSGLSQTSKGRLARGPELHGMRNQTTRFVLRYSDCEMKRLWTKKVHGLTTAQKRDKISRINLTGRM
jgi:hypothetical protein